MGEQCGRTAAWASAGSAALDPACLDEQLALEGELLIQADDGASGSEGPAYSLRVDRSSAHPLRFESVPGFVTGDRIRVSGYPTSCVSHGGERPPVAGEITVLSALKLADALPSQAGSGTLGDQRVLAVVVDYLDEPNLISSDAVRSLVFGRTSEYFRENSYGQTWLTGDTVGPIRIERPEACDAWAISDRIRSALRSRGTEPTQYRRLIYFLPYWSRCEWAGYGTIGGNPSVSWINGGLDSNVVAHELGHNFGLYHSNAIDCGALPLSESCRVIPYGDVVEIMGVGLGGHTSAFQKERLRWLGYGESPPISVVDRAGIYFIEPYESAGSRPKALKIYRRGRQQTAEPAYFYVEYRTPTGFDAVLQDTSRTCNLASGLLVRLGAPDKPESSVLLNMNPSRASWHEAALESGATFTDPVSGVGIRLLRSDPTGALVEVIGEGDLSAPKPRDCG